MSPQAGASATRRCRSASSTTARCSGDGRPDERPHDRRRRDDDRPPRAPRGGVAPRTSTCCSARLDAHGRRRSRTPSTRTPTRTVEVTDLREAADDAPVIKLVHSIVAQAVQQGASDIHVNPEEGDTRVLFRVDGVLLRARPGPAPDGRRASSRASRSWPTSTSPRSALPQDGRFGADGRRPPRRHPRGHAAHSSTASRVVMRILDKPASRSSLDALGMRDARPDPLREARSASPTAPCSSPARPARARPTTLYAALGALNTPDKTHHHDRGSRRVRARGHQADPDRTPKAGLTFATGLRSMLRADPDVIMVGEIRDRETAQIAVESALTGHLVLSTLHTNDAPSAARAPDRHGHRAVPGGLVDRLHRRPAARAHALQRTAGSRPRSRRRRCSRTASSPARASPPTRRPAAGAAAAPATRAGSASTRRCR